MLEGDVIPVNPPSKKLKQAQLTFFSKRVASPQSASATPKIRTEFKKRKHSDTECPSAKASKSLKHVDKCSSTTPISTTLCSTETDEVSSTEPDCSNSTAKPPTNTIQRFFARTSGEDVISSTSPASDIEEGKENVPPNCSTTDIPSDVVEIDDSDDGVTLIKESRVVLGVIPVDETTGELIRNKGEKPDEKCIDRLDIHNFLTDDVFVNDKKQSSGSLKRKQDDDDVVVIVDSSVASSETDVHKDVIKIDSYFKKLENCTIDPKCGNALSGNGIANVSTIESMDVDIINIVPNVVNTTDKRTDNLQTSNTDKRTDNSLTSDSDKLSSSKCDDSFIDPREITPLKGKNSVIHVTEGSPNTTLDSPLIKTPTSAVRTPKPISAKKAERMAQRKKVAEEKERVRQAEKAEKQRAKDAADKERQEKKDKVLQEKNELKMKKEMERQEVLEQREKEKQEKHEKMEEEKRKRQEIVDAKNEEKKKKDEEKRLKDDEKNREKEEEIMKQRKAQDKFQSFFTKQKTSPTGKAKPTSTTTTMKNTKFMEFELKENMKMAPLIRRVFGQGDRDLCDGLMLTQNQESLYLNELRHKYITPRSMGHTWSWVSDDVIMMPDQTSTTHRAKLLQFHENTRPAYYGTMRKSSKYISARQPLAKDKDLLDYEVDSDDEWEEEEPGESLSNSEGEENKAMKKTDGWCFTGICRERSTKRKERMKKMTGGWWLTGICRRGEDNKEEEGDDEEDDGWMVPHGYLSAGEGCEEDDEVTVEKMKIRQKAKQDAWETELKRKQAPVLPQAAGCCWGEGDRDVGVSAHWELLLSFQICTVLTLPIETSHSGYTATEPTEACPSATKPKTTIKAVPEKAMPHLIRLIHGNTMGISKLINEFRRQWSLVVSGKQEGVIRCSPEGEAVSPGPGRGAVSPCPGVSPGPGEASPGPRGWSSEGVSPGPGLDSSGGYGKLSEGMDDGDGLRTVESDEGVNKLGLVNSASKTNTSVDVNMEGGAESTDKCTEDVDMKVDDPGLVVTGSSAPSVVVTGSFGLGEASDGPVNISSGMSETINTSADPVDSSAGPGNTGADPVDTSTGQVDSSTGPANSNADEIEIDCGISKMQIRNKIMAISTRQKRANYRKVCVYVHAEILAQYGLTDLSTPIDEEIKTPLRVSPSPRCRTPTQDLAKNNQMSISKFTSKVFTNPLLSTPSFTLKPMKLDSVFTSPENETAKAPQGWLTGAANVGPKHLESAPMLPIEQNKTPKLNPLAKFFKKPVAENNDKVDTDVQIVADVKNDSVNVNNVEIDCVKLNCSTNMVKNNDLGTIENVECAMEVDSAVVDDNVVIVLD